MLAIAQVGNFSGCRTTIYAGSRGISKERSIPVHLRCQQNSPIIYVTNHQPAQVVCRCSDNCIFDLSPAFIRVNMCCHQLHFYLSSVVLSPVKPFCSACEGASSPVKPLLKVRRRRLCLHLQILSNKLVCHLDLVVTTHGCVFPVIFSLWHRLCRSILVLLVNSVHTFINAS